MVEYTQFSLKFVKVGAVIMELRELLREVDSHAVDILGATAAPDPATTTNRALRASQAIGHITELCRDIHLYEEIQKLKIHETVD